MTSFSPDQVLALAPDAASAKAGSALASARKWGNLGRTADGRCIWGECQGSGKDPYQTRADLSGPGFQCSCPSRKLPCKHSLGLLLLFANAPSAFAERAEPPAWVAEWLAERDKRAAQRAAKAETRDDETGGGNGAKKARPAASSSPSAVAAREAKVAAGMRDLSLWLRDLVRGGTAAAGAQPPRFFEQPAARLVDAQAPGAARLVRTLGSARAEAAAAGRAAAAAPNGGGAGWPARMLERAAALHLLAEGVAHFATLPPETQADVRAALGWARAEDELLATAPAVRDRWVTLGQIVEEDEHQQNLWVRRTWLAGRETGRSALLLQFAFGGQGHGQQFAEAPRLRTEVDAELVFYPGAHPLRAVVRELLGPAHAATDFPGHADGAAATAAYAAAIAANPWTERFPLALRDVVPVRHADGAMALRDVRGLELPLVPPVPHHYYEPWHLLAVSGGRPVWAFGEWDGERLLPLSVAAPPAGHASLFLMRNFR